MPVLPHPEKLKEMADILSDMMPGVGFAIVTFEFGDNPGRYGNYISNGQRPDMIRALRECADRLEKRQDYKTIDPR